jgi:hypothetical protein
MRWKTFEASAPELAGQCSQKLNRQISYLATIKKWCAWLNQVPGSLDLFLFPDISDRICAAVTHVFQIG